MSTPFPIRFSERARRAIVNAADWWALNRDKAPTAFAEELERVLALIAAQPEIGIRTAAAKFPTLRRIHLRRIRYYLYYRVTEGDSPAIEILGFWHSSRGGKPEIREAPAVFALRAA